MKRAVVDAVDTLYHAVALNLPDAFLITADERFYHKAESLGHILLLKDINRLPVGGK